MEMTEPEKPAAGGLKAAMERIGALVNSEDAKEWLAEQAEQERRERIWSLRLPLAIERSLLTGVDEHGARLTVTDAERRLTEWMGKGRRIIVLQGVPGTGKSYAMARALAASDRARWVKAAEFGALAPWDPAVDGYRYVPLLGIDDLGLEHRQGRQRIEELICDRHGGAKVTIATTNQTSKEFAGAYSQRVLSRIREVGVWMECTEVVRRRAQQNLNLGRPQ
jgi:DNA replication protein DnaC